MADYMLDGEDLTEEQKDSVEGFIHSINVAIDASEDVNIHIKIRRNQKESWSDGSWLKAFAIQNRADVPSEQPPPSTTF